MADALDRLRIYLNSLLIRETNSKLGVRRLLAPHLDDILTGIKGVITDPTSSPIQRLRAAELLLNVLDKALHFELADQKRTADIARYRANQAENRAKEHIARADAQKMSLSLAKEARRKHKEDMAVLRRAESDLKEQGISL